MSSTEATNAAESSLGAGLVDPKPTEKNRKNKTFPTKLGKKSKPVKEGYVSGRVRAISVKNSGESIYEYHFELFGKKAGCRRYALDTADLRRLSLFAGLVGVAQSTNAKISVVSTSDANGLDFVTELEVKTKR